MTARSNTELCLFAMEIQGDLLGGARRRAEPELTVEE